MIGQSINGFVIKDVLGEGGMGIVYFAENSKGEKVAIKNLKPEHASNSVIRKYFIEEANTMQKLQGCIYIRQILNTVKVNGAIFLILEYLEGKDLSAYVRESGSVNDITILKKWTTQLLMGLQYTHERGLIHCDINPSNIFITTSGDLKILDFGVAMNLFTTRRTAIITGGYLSVIYLSPEQRAEKIKIDCRSDIYSVGQLLTFILTGENPFFVDQNHFTGIMDHDIYSFIAKATCFEPEKRFKSCNEMISILENDFKTNEVEEYNALSQKDKSCSSEFNDNDFIIDDPMDQSYSLQIFMQYGKYGYEYRLGNEVIKPIFEKVADFQYGLYIESYLEFCIEKNWTPCPHYLAAVCFKGKWGFINQYGKIIIPIEYDKVAPFCFVFHNFGFFEYAPVCQGHKWAYHLILDSDLDRLVHHSEMTFIYDSPQRIEEAIGAWT